MVCVIGLLESVALQKTKQHTQTQRFNIKRQQQERRLDQNDTFWTIFFADIKHAAFELLPYLPPGLCLDLGAAAGVFTKLIRKNSPSSRVFAFEPFAGNYPHFRRNVGTDSSVKLYEGAVAERTGNVRFFVPSTVRGSEEDWQSYTGYSSLGHVVESADTSFSASVEVKSYALDDFVDEQVRFCKIDIQGGEKNALRGASRLLAGGQVDMFLVEFDGDADILSMLSAADYIFIDCKYLLVCARNRPASSQWTALEPISLSTGVPGFNGWPLDCPREQSAYCGWLKEQSRQIGGVWTDMLCIRRAFLPDFLEATGKLQRSLLVAGGNNSDTIKTS